MLAAAVLFVGSERSCTHTAAGDHSQSARTARHSLRELPHRRGWRPIRAVPEFDHTNELPTAAACTKSSMHAVPRKTIFTDVGKIVRIATPISTSAKWHGLRAVPHGSWLNNAVQQVKDHQNRFRFSALTRGAMRGLP